MERSADFLRRIECFSKVDKALTGVTAQKEKRRYLLLVWSVLWALTVQLAYASSEAQPETLEGGPSQVPCKFSGVYARGGEASD